ncbi:DUF1127 domain-containing protein [Litoreibacter roseus]|uniref:YjiS-like domain-containing protein n=1 Tax=Litoreibacter roseus TaxID=2601869 RepID=A0A6N6JEI9_9RHOB|nr:DUF1127 domain-containing protein [Litoreibacter roseus]GFE63708.1 hypothetical protein KIN_07820 [Litoreibacter roseus]
MALLSLSHHAQLSALSARNTLALLPRAAVAVAYVLMKWDEACRTRHTLKGLTDHELKDIGLTRDQAMSEADKPFWRL